MTTLFVDGVHIAFEGVARLRWAAGPWMLNETASHQAVLESVWPGRDLQVYLRRQIEHGQKTLVIVDDREPILRLPLQRAPRVPFGVVDVGGDCRGERCLLIPPFNWLRDRDRFGGNPFSITSGAIACDRAGARNVMWVSNEAWSEPVSRCDSCSSSKKCRCGRFNGRSKPSSARIGR